MNAAYYFIKESTGGHQMLNLEGKLENCNFMLRQTMNKIQVQLLVCTELDKSNNKNWVFNESNIVV